LQYIFTKTSQSKYAKCQTKLPILELKPCFGIRTVIYHSTKENRNTSSEFYDELNKSVRILITNSTEFSITALVKEFTFDVSKAETVVRQITKLY